MSELGRRQKADLCQKDLHAFVLHFWPVLEPQTTMVDGWPLKAMCLHLEAVTEGKIKRLLINISPGSMKSLLVNVFWPAWEWIRYPHYRYVTFSYAAHLTERDNNRFRTLVNSPQYKSLYGNRFDLVKIGETLVSNTKTGWKLASSIGGVGTGERGNRVILDDPHNVAERESEKVRGDTVDWFKSAMSNRLNDMETGAIIVIMQRVHQQDVSGFIIDSPDGLDYVHLMIPAEYESYRHCTTPIWSDPRTVEGEIFWKERLSAAVLKSEATRMGPYDYAGQYQQRPAPKGGAIFRDEWWQYLEMPWHGRPPMGFEYIVASLDPAYTTKQQNDYSALTVWGVWRNRDDEPKVFLLDSWQKRLTLHGTTADKVKNEDEETRFSRTSDGWGLVEWVAYTCKKHKIDRLLIEAKASGLSVAQEMSRLYANEGWGIELVDPRGDKVARAHSVVPLFSDKFIFVPAAAEGNELLPYEFADELMKQAEVFPRASHDDLVDSMTQALRHLRDFGLAVRREERQHDYEEAMRYRPPLPPLYQV